MSQESHDADPATGQSKLNHRLRKRVAVRLPVRVSTIDPETDPWTGKLYFRSSDETCADVSRGGAFVLTSDSIAPGRRILLELRMPSGEFVQTLGRVAWSRSSLSPAGKTERSGFGVEFLGGAADELSALESFLERSWRRQQREDPQKAVPGTTPSHSA
jgi:hypothetical protein